MVSKDEALSLGKAFSRDRTCTAQKHTDHMNLSVPS